MAISVQTLRSLVTPFLVEKGVAYVSVGCYRIYVASVPAVKCKRCGGCHKNHEIRGLAELEALTSLDPADKAR